MCQGLSEVIKGLDTAGAHLGGRWEAGAAWLPFPIPWSIIYLQQNAGKHLADENTREKSVGGHGGGEGGLDPAV